MSKLYQHHHITSLNQSLDQLLTTSDFPCFTNILSQHQEHSQPPDLSSYFGTAVSQKREKRQRELHQICVEEVDRQLMAMEGDPKQKEKVGHCLY